VLQRSHKINLFWKHFRLVARRIIWIFIYTFWWNDVEQAWRQVSVQKRMESVSALKITGPWNKRRAATVESCQQAVNLSPRTHTHAHTHTVHYFQHAGILPSAFRVQTNFMLAAGFRFTECMQLNPTTETDSRLGFQEISLLLLSLKVVLLLNTRPLWSRWIKYIPSLLSNILAPKYKVVQIWPGQTVTCLHTNSPGHIWTTLYYFLCKFN
jgi:hypothetical protein